jgi:hypothetical protein
LARSKVRLRLSLVVAAVSWLAGMSVLAPAAQARRHSRSSKRHSTSQCTIYASPSGSSHARGRRRLAPTNLSSALAAAVPGSKVCLEPGTYEVTSNVWLSHSGTRSAPIVYRSYGGEALIQYTSGPSDAYLSGGVLETSSGSDWGGTHDIVIDGLTIDGEYEMGSGIAVIAGSHNVTIRNCGIVNTGQSGISLNATDYVTVVHNKIFHAGYNQGWSSGISLWDGGPSPVYGGRTAWYNRYAGFHNFIVDNIVSGSHDNSPNHTDGNGIIVDGSGSIPPALIANNLVYENGGGGIVVGYNSGSVWVVNNTAYANGLDPMVDGGRTPEYEALDAGHVHFVNDLAYGHATTATSPTGYTYAAHLSSIEWLTDLAYNGVTSALSTAVTHHPRRYRYADPRFIWAPPLPTESTPWAFALPPWDVGHDFKLRHGSPAIATGTDPVTALGMRGQLASGMRHYLSRDLASRRRTRYDIGAY